MQIVPILTTVCEIKLYCRVCAQCVGPSMLPTFNANGDLVLTEHYSVYMQKIQPGRGILEDGSIGVLSFQDSTSKGFDAPGASVG